MQANRQNVVWTNDTAFIISVFFKLLIFAMFVYPFAHYSLFVQHENANSSETASTLNNFSEGENVSSEQLGNPARNKTAVKIVRQPGCPISHLQVILDELLLELYVKKEMCTPQDVDNLEKHKPPKQTAGKNKSSEPRGTVVIYIAVGLLMTSVGAAFLDVYKAKKRPSGGKGKPPLTRKCSLADLTVERHNRKEMMVRKDSILEEPEQSKTSGLRPLPLHRRCSFPVSPGEFNRETHHTPRASYDYGMVLLERPDDASSSRRTSFEGDSSSADNRHVRILRRH